MSNTSSYVLAFLGAVGLAGCATGAETASLAPAAATASAAAKEQTASHGGSAYDRPGYITEVEDGRLWVFEADTEEYAQFKAQGEPAKMVTRIAAGPERMTLRSTDPDVIDGYLLSRPGYATKVEDGRLWVFEADSKEYAQFKAHGEPAKMVTRIAAAPNGMTIRSTSAEVIDGYLLSRPGYVTKVEDGRLWVFEADSEEYAQFKAHGEPAKMVTRIAAAPNGMTIRSTDPEVIDGYLLSRPGYVTKVEDGRLWVLEADSKAYAQFKAHGEPAKMVTRIGAGPNGMTIRSTEPAVIDGYLASNP